MMKRSGKERSQRQLRVAERVKQIISEHMHREFFADEVLSNPAEITVCDVQVSPDLRQATVFVSSLIDRNDIKDIVRALNVVSSNFNHAIAKGLETKNTPKVSFAVDKSIEAMKRMDQLLDND
tara:strand:+ start:1562 stop:1930 length:369 start_codon:yes stop_codon:yes gene_type:complete